MAVLYRNPCYSEACYNEVELYIVFVWDQADLSPTWLRI